MGTFEIIRMGLFTAYCKKFTASVKSLSKAEVEIGKHSEQHIFVVIMKCWGIEHFLDGLINIAGFERLQIDKK